MEKFDAIKELENLVETTAKSPCYSGEEYRKMVMVLAIVQALQAMADAIRHYEVWGR